MMYAVHYRQHRQAYDGSKVWSAAAGGDGQLTVRTLHYLEQMKVFNAGIGW